MGIYLHPGLAAGTVFRRLPHPRLQTVKLKQDVIAHRVHERTECFGVVDSALAERFQNPQEGFLCDIRDRVRGPQARAQLDRQQFGEVRREVALGLRIGLFQTLDIPCVESLPLHDHAIIRRNLQMFWEKARVMTLRAGVAGLDSTPGPLGKRRLPRRQSQSGDRRPSIRRRFTLTKSNAASRATPQAMQRRKRPANIAKHAGLGYQACHLVVFIGVVTSRTVSDPRK